MARTIVLDDAISEANIRVVRDAFKKSRGNCYLIVHSARQRPLYCKIAAPVVEFVEQDPGAAKKGLEKVKAAGPVILVHTMRGEAMPRAGWDFVVGSLAGLGMKRVALGGEAAVTTAFEKVIEKTWKSKKPWAANYRELLETIAGQRPAKKSLPTLYRGCVLGAFMELSKRSKEFGFEVSLARGFFVPKPKMPKRKPRPKLKRAKIARKR